jgi:hypothetical protein
MGRELAFFVSNPSPRGKVPLAVLPGKSPLATPLDAAFFIVVLWIARTALRVQLTF